MSKSTITSAKNVGKSGGGAVIVLVAEDADAVARGNGYDGNGTSDARARNGYSHTHVSAELTLEKDYDITPSPESLGDLKEDATSEPGINSKDEYKDQYNNELGRRAGDWLKNWLKEEEEEGRTYTEAEKKKFLDDIIKDTDKSGDMIKNEDDHSKTEGFTEDGPEYQNPKEDVEWTEPSDDWQGKSDGRDYSGVDSFNENPI